MKSSVIEARLEFLVEDGFASVPVFEILPEAISRGDELTGTANSSTRMPLATIPRETSTTWMEIPGIGP